MQPTSYRNLYIALSSLWYTLKRVCMLLLPLFISFSSFAQQKTYDIPTDWFLLDPEYDSIQGISVDKAYRELLKNRTAYTVVVAVIDGGVDIDHEDLQGSIWTNEKEIPNNSIDDDLNGYIDDVHGWNFIGGQKGNVHYDAAELTREYTRLKAKFEKKEGKRIRKKEKKEYEQYKEIKKYFENAVQSQKENFELYNNLYRTISQSVDSLKRWIGVEVLTRDILEKYKPNNEYALLSKIRIINILENINLTGESLEKILTELKKMVEQSNQALRYVYNEQFNARALVGDRYENLYEKGYGNNDVKGPDAEHGTHISGIIGANRTNKIGIRGIANNVKIMPVRVVPSGGDERDKDVANAILYAVDNGAQIINMSFGKSISPQKEAVDKAVQYAEKKGVLLIHAAGNDGRNIDIKSTFPSRYYSHRKEAKNWLEVGGSSEKADEHFIAYFSNYGKKSVDLFAPGIAIHSTTSDNEYRTLNGTSMASPMVTGVAALLLSYFPRLTALQVKNIIRSSVRRYKGLNVFKPGGDGDVKIESTELSSTGGIIDAYKAVKKALQLTAIAGE